MHEPIFPNREGSHRNGYVLVANPWKPLGRFITDEECDKLCNWLEDSDRRGIIDAVYDFGPSFHATTQRLVQTGHALLLHSVTKGWLWPKTFGIALSGTTSDELEASFRN